MLNANTINPPLKAILSTFLRVDDHEVNRIPMKGPLILAMNHINWLDAPVGFSHLHPRPLTAFAKIETWNKLFLRILFDAWDTIPIRRGEIDFDAFKKAEEYLAKGKIVVIAPEGTRSQDGCLNAGYPGIVFLAMRSQAPILPVAILGHENFNQKFRIYRRTDMAIKVGQPFKLRFPDQRLTREVRQEMTDEIMFEIARLLPDGYRGNYRDLSHARREYIELI
jgi:1-acyl-sn-glycerol-3-phosphate acyltransferase